MKRLTVIALAGCTLTAPASAQQAGGTGTVVGFVVDSIHNMPLANAFVVLEGSGLGAASRETGEFAIPDVPAGTYRAALMHEALDAVRLTVRTGEVTVVSGDTLRLFLGLPSAATILSRRCGPSRGEPDSAALFGVATDERGNRAEGATVLLAWRQIVIGPDFGMREHEQHRAGATNPDGTFQICGLPDDLAAEARVARGVDTSGTVPVRIPLTGVGLVALGLPQSSEEERPRDGLTIRGRVVERSGRPVPDAQIRVGEAVTTATDSLGRFAAGSLPAGSQTLSVRRVGYEMREIPLLLRSGQDVELSIVLEDFVPLLEEVVVRARRDVALERVGFGVRERAGSGFYVWPEEIDRRMVSRLSDYLMEAPMLRVTGVGSNRRVTGRRNSGSGCVTYAIDGRPAPGNADLMLNPQEIGAIEVYARGVAPALFMGINDCEVVLVWTKAYLRL